jgi:hypothetical protein
VRRQQGAAAQHRCTACLYLHLTHLVTQASPVRCLHALVWQWWHEALCFKKDRACDGIMCRVTCKSLVALSHHHMRAACPALSRGTAALYTCTTPCNSCTCAHLHLFLLTSTAVLEGGHLYKSVRHVHLCAPAAVLITCTPPAAVLEGGQHLVHLCVTCTPCSPAQPVGVCSAERDTCTQQLYPGVMRAAFARLPQALLSSTLPVAACVVPTDS